MIKLTIDGREVELERPVTVLEAAKRVGVTIPTLCYFEGLPNFGGCRLCLVEVERLPKLQTSCTLMASDGMVVRTETEQIRAARRAMLEFLLINHPLDCPYCDKAGECTLQDLVARYGPEAGRFAEGKRKHPESLDDPIIVRNMERCVLCTRCVRMCEDLQGAYAISVSGRGGHSLIEPFSGGRYDCEYCGNCLTVCPVGAIMSRLHRHSYRPWFVEREVETVCGYCGVGCSMVLQVREDSIVRTIPRFGLGLNNGLLCVRGRFGYDAVDGEGRLTTPLIRVEGRLEPVGWEEALAFVASRLGEIKDSHGGRAVGAIASGRCTNEDNYMLQKLMRFVIGSNNIDSAARFHYAPAEAFLESVFGQGITANLIPGIADSDGVFVTGGDPTAINPVLGLQVRAARRSGGKVIVLGPPGGLKRFVDHELVPMPYSDEVVLSAIVGGLMEAGRSSGENRAVEERLKELRLPSEEELSAAGIGPEALARAVDDLLKMTNPVVILGPEIMDGARASKRLFLVGAVAYLMNARIYLLSERPNYQGVMDMGCVPDLLPGGGPIGLEMLRDRIEAVLGLRVPEEGGLTLFEMVDEAERGGLRALYVMGEDLLFSLPDRARVQRALGRLDLLVVQDIYLTETAAMADVVLPAAAWSEKDGTFTNLERRVQLLRRGRYPRAGREDWRIIADIGGRLGMEKTYRSAEEVWEEVTHASPLHAGLGYSEIAGGGAVWPYHSEPLKGTEAGFAVQGLGELPGVEAPGGPYLMPERPLFHSGTLSRRSRALLSIHPEPYLVIPPSLSEELGVTDGGRVRVVGAKGTMVLKVRIDPDQREGTVLLSNTFEGANFAGLVGFTADPVTGCLTIEDNTVRLERVDDEAL